MGRATLETDVHVELNLTELISCAHEVITLMPFLFCTYVRCAVSYRFELTIMPSMVEAKNIVINGASSIKITTPINQVWHRVD